ncbi:hypothetical protein [Tissierella sp.]|uniref:hypothetical protein n=1 Tax=Tissierella sp. TaxID=41274 RepID=UPI0030257620
MEIMTREEILKIAKPIFFNTEMVKAILEDRKTVTRRVVKPQILDDGKWGYTMFTPENHISFRKSKEAKEWFFKLPYIKGGILYVRETWMQLCRVDENGYTDFDDVMTYYLADGIPDINLYDYDGFLLDDQTIKWKPSIHMPKEVARIFLKVTDIKVERLQDITIDGVEQEGIPLVYPIIDMIDSEHLKKFIAVWNSIIKKQDLDRCGWEANPWVWVIEFERIEVEK